MSPAKIQAAFWAAILLCALLIVVALTGGFGRSVSLGLLLGGVLGIAVSFAWRTRASARAAEAQSRRDAVRVPELERQVQSGLPLEIAGSSGIGLLLIMLVMVGLVTLWAVAQPDWQVIASAAFAWALALGSALSVAPLVGKPLLRIAHDGIETRAYGKLLWSEIDGIDLSEIRARGQTVYYRLHLLVPKLAERRQQMHPATRLLRTLLPTLRAELRLRLSATSESPHVILKLCQALWTRRTGRRTLWRSSMSDEMLADLRNGEQQLAELTRAGDLAESDPAAAMEILDRLEKERRPPADPKVARKMAEAEAEMKALFAKHSPVEAMRIHRQLIDDRRRKREASALAARRTHWLTWVVAAIAALYLILQMGWLLSQ